MRELKAEKPIESPEGMNVIERLMARLSEEGFTTDNEPGDLDQFGEMIYRRAEKISFAPGETVFIFTKLPELNERILRQTSESVVNAYKARDFGSKALSVLQSTTVYHCLVTEGDQPYSEMLSQYIVRRGGATFIPVIMVPEINQVLYPDVNDRTGAIRPRVEYLQFLLGERLETVNMHKGTVQAFYVSMAVMAMLLVAIVFSVVT